MDTSCHGSEMEIRFLPYDPVKSPWHPMGGLEENQFLE